MSVRLLPIRVMTSLAAAAKDAGLCSDAASTASELWLENRRSYFERYPHANDAPRAFNDLKPFELGPDGAPPPEEVRELLAEYIYQVSESSGWKNSPTKKLCEGLFMYLEAASGVGRGRASRPEVGNSPEDLIA